MAMVKTVSGFEEHNRVIQPEATSQINITVKIESMLTFDSF